MIVGAVLVAGGAAILARLSGSEDPEGEDPIEQAQRLLSRAQSKVSEIEAGLRTQGRQSPQTA